MAKTKRKAATAIASEAAKPSRARKPRASTAKRRDKSTAAKSTGKAESRATPRLLSGGNPQIAKGDGDAPVQAYIRAMPGWKRNVGTQLDELIVRTVPGVRKAVRWNSPFYGVEDADGDRSWFIAFHCITKYVKVSFFRGTSLSPVPPVESKVKEVRYFHIHENDPIDVDLLTSWIRQASRMPGMQCF